MVRALETNVMGQLLVSFVGFRWEAHMPLFLIVRKDGPLTAILIRGRVLVLCTTSLVNTYLGQDDYDYIYQEIRRSLDGDQSLNSITSTPTLMFLLSPCTC